MWRLDYWSKVDDHSRPILWEDERQKDTYEFFIDSTQGAGYTHRHLDLILILHPHIGFRLG